MKTGTILNNNKQVGNGFTQNEAVYMYICVISVCVCVCKLPWLCDHCSLCVVGHATLY